MESYVERYHRELKEAAQKETQKGRKRQKVKKNSFYGEMQKEVQKDGTDTGSEGQTAQKESGGGQPSV